MFWLSPTYRRRLRENLAQFALLVLVNAFVGAMVGIAVPWFAWLLIACGLAIIAGQVVRKFVYVPGKLVNVVG